MNRLRELREQKHLDQKEIAAIIGKSFQAYNHYELGRREPDIETLKKLADYYNVSIDFLLGRDGTAAPTNKDEAIAKLMEIYNQLTPEQQQELEAYAKFKASQNSNK